MTTGLRIPIDADLSGLNQQIKKFGQDASKVLGSLSGKATIDTASAKKDLAELQKAAQGIHDALASTAASDVTGKAVEGMAKEFEVAASSAKKLEQAVGAIGGKGAASNIGKTLNETRKLISELDKAKRLQAALAKEGHKFSLGQAAEIEKDFQHFLKNGGNSAKKFQKFGDLATYMNNWRDVGGGELSARRQYRAMLQQFGVNSPGAPNPMPQQKSFADFMKESLARAGRGLASSASPVSGVGANIMGNAAEEASASPGGLFSAAGMGRIAAGGAVGLLAYGGMKAIGSVYSHIKGAEDENTGYADLKRQLGDTASSFEQLRGAVRSASEGLDTTFGEGGKLAAAYVHGSGVDGMSAKDLRNELLGSGGFSRAMGLDPSAGVGLFSTLRHNQVSSSETDNKRLAMMIGESIARAGVFTKADEVMAAVANFTQSATRSSFTPANVEGFTGGMSNLMAMKMAGLDPNASSAILGKADAAIKGGGNEAARNFFLGMMQRQLPGMNAIDIGALQDTGAFGTAEMAFGENSPAMRAAKANNDTALMKKYRGFAKSGGNATNLDRILDGLAGSGTDSMRENLKGFFGYNTSEANAMITAYRTNGGIGTSVSNLSKYGIDTGSMAPTAIKHLLEMEYSEDPDILKKKTAFLRGQDLSPEEKKQLSAAEQNPGEGSGNLRMTLAKLLSKHNMEMTEGDVSRKNMASLENLASDVATKLIPATNSIREAIVAVAQVVTKPFGGFRDSYTEGEQAKSIAETNKKLMDAKTPEPGQGESPKVVPLDMNAKDSVSRFKNDHTYDEYFKRAGEATGVDWRVLKQIGVQESGLRADAVNVNKNGTRDIGVMQLNNRYNAERGVTNPEDPEQNIMAGAGVFARALRDSKGDLRGAFRRYNGSGPQAEAYADKSMRLYSQLVSDGAIANPKFGAMQVPAGANTSPGQSSPSQVSVKVQGEFNLRDQSTGRKLAAPVQVSSIAAPKAAGVR